MPQLKAAKVLLGLVALAFVPARTCLADTINLGFFTFLETPDSGQFDIHNGSGVNASVFPDTSFPSVTPVPFTDLTLFVNFADGSAQEFDPASGYFTLAGDNLSFVGETDGDFTSPISSAILTGTFEVTNLVLNDGSVVNIDPSFFAILTSSSGAGDIGNGDFGLIQASTTLAATPEPSMAILLGCGCVALFIRRRAIG
jgi:hypothetical protein